MGDDLFMFTLTRESWERVVDCLYESASERDECAAKMPSDITYAGILREDARKLRDLAEYIELMLPEEDEED